MNDKEIAKEIVIKLIDAKCIQFEQFPEADTYVDLVCKAYEQVYKTVNSVHKVSL